MDNSFKIIAYLYIDCRFCQYFSHKTPPCPAGIHGISIQKQIWSSVLLTFQLDWALSILYAKNMTVDEKITDVIRTGSGKMIDLARLGTALPTAALLLAGAFTGNPVFYGIATNPATG